jgi:hypothetical protein
VSDGFLNLFMSLLQDTKLAPGERALTLSNPVLFNLQVRGAASRLSIVR